MQANGWKQVLTWLLAALMVCMPLQAAQEVREKALEAGIETGLLGEALEAFGLIPQDQLEADLLRVTAFIESEEVQHYLEMEEVQELLEVLIARGMRLALEEPELTMQVLETLGVEEAYINLYQSWVGTDGVSVESIQAFRRSEAGQMLTLYLEENLKDEESQKLLEIVLGTLDELEQVQADSLEE